MFSSQCILAQGDLIPLNRSVALGSLLNLSVPGFLLLSKMGLISVPISPGAVRTKHAPVPITGLDT